jgi:glycine amidinotransferase
VIVGRLESAMFPEATLINRHTFPPGEWEEIERTLGRGGVPYPPDVVAAAQRELDEFIAILQGEGVRVRRPDVVDYAKAFSSPDWQVPSGFSSANPRDPFLVIGDEIIEAPMADRSRYFETLAYRSLFTEYFRAGARWTAAPKPRLSDAQFQHDFKPASYGGPLRFVVNEFEPTFDAADFVRCGRDIIGQKSHVTNGLGIEWLRRHLGPKFRVHEVHSRCPQAMHIDTSLVPLAPGKVMVNPEFLDVEEVRAIFKGWDVLIAPRPVGGAANKFDVISIWANLNVLVIDEKRVIVEKSQEPTIAALRDWGFEPIPCAFEHYHPFMGAFHCATLDIYRHGELKSYL